MTSDKYIINSSSPSIASKRSSSLKEAESLRQYLQASISQNTKKTYRSAIIQFEKWGGRLPTDRETILRYIMDRANTLNPRTIDLHLTAISQWHNYQGVIDPVKDPLIRKTMDGIRRTHGKPKRKAKALRLEHIAQMVFYIDKQPDSAQKFRDLALILTGFFGAFRRSELVSITIKDLIWEPEGLIIHLPHSKTDQENKGLLRALPFGPNDHCPGQAIKKWIKYSHISEGPLFRSINRWGQIGDDMLNPGTINDTLKRIGKSCQFDFIPNLSSHSFRRGLSTSAAREHVDFALIKKQGGWKSDATVWEYIEEGQNLKDNAALILLKKMEKLLEK